MDCLSAHDKAVVNTILDPFHLIPDQKSLNQFEDEIQGMQTSISLIQTIKVKIILLFYCFYYVKRK